jgi:hypothetical protein
VFSPDGCAEEYLLWAMTIFTDGCLSCLSEVQ